MSEFDPSSPGGAQERTPEYSAAGETELWHSLDIGSPHELGIGQARQQFPQLVSAALNGETYVVRNMSRRSEEAVVIVSLNQLHRIAAALNEPASGADLLARLPFRGANALRELTPAPLPHPGLPQFLGAALNPAADGDALAHR